MAIVQTEHAGHKPLLRGVLHQWAAVYALGAGTGLVVLAPTPNARIAVAIYAASLVLLLTISAVYHRCTWDGRPHLAAPGGSRLRSDLPRPERSSARVQEWRVL